MVPKVTDGAALSDSGQSVRIRSFDGGSERDWCELARDILALANSGGGRIFLGASLDEKNVLMNLNRYTDSVFADGQVVAVNDSAGLATVITVGPALFPLGFSTPGIGDSSENSATQMEVAPGFYFRHGDRSEPGTTADMRAFFERLLRRVRRRWLRSIRRVLTQPITSNKGTASKQPTARRVTLERAVLQPVRIVTDPNAPALQPQDVDRLYPWRQKDLLDELNSRLGRRMLTTYDIQAVRRHHRLDERPDFVFHLPGAGRRYSPAMADWIVAQHGRDQEFFQRARAADQQLLRLRRKKPR